MKIASKVVRRVEMILWISGIILIGGTSGATFARWNYQMQQERALFERGPAVASAAPITSTTTTPARTTPSLLPAPEPAPPPSIAPKTGPVSAASPPLEAKAATRSAYARIEIPRLGLAAIVKEGADEKTLARAVGLVPGSARPGEQGNVVLAGHRDTFFWPLRKVKVNDRIRLRVPPHTYEYEVQAVRVVEPHETSVLESKGFEELTLVTCYPFRFVGPAPERFIVSATRVN